MINADHLILANGFYLHVHFKSFYIYSFDFLMYILNLFIFVTFHIVQVLFFFVLIDFMEDHPENDVFLRDGRFLLKQIP